MTRDEALRILGLESNATLADAKKAYRDLVKVIHPDKDSSPGAKQRFILVQDAYEVITNQQMRDQSSSAEKAPQERTDSNVHATGYFKRRGEEYRVEQHA